MDFPSESNSLTAMALFAASIVIDAFTARDVATGAGAAPTSLRTSAVVLAACLAGPPIREWMVFEQRAVVGAALFGVALAGAHAGSEGQRTADAIFVALTCAGAIYTFCSGGPEKGADGKRIASRSKDATPYVKREALINLALASLFYSSVRVVRAGFDHPVAVRGYTNAATTYDGTERELQGYAYSSSTGVLALSFGGAAGAGTAVALFADWELRTQGTAAATLLLTVTSIAQLTAAFVATLSQSEAMGELPAVWSTGACASGTLCPAAQDARRLTMVNQCASALWINGIGTFVLAYAPSIRLQSRTAMLGTQRNFEILVYGLVGTSVAVASLLGYLSFTGAEALTDFVCVGATLAVFTTAFIDSLVGVVAFGICLTADVATNWAADGAASVFTNLVRVRVLHLVVLLGLYAVVSLFTEVLWRWLPRALVDACDVMVGLLVVAGTSAATALYLTAAATAASYDGQLLDDALLRGPDNRFARTAAAGIVEHWLPLLVWLPLYACRCEAERIDWRVRAAAWYGSAALPAFVWLLSLAAFERATTHAVGWMDSSSFLVGLVLVAVVPWSVLAWA